MKPPPPLPLSSYSLHTCSRRGSGEASCAAWGRLLLRSPNPLLSLLMIAAGAPRQLTHTHSHMLIGTCQTAQPSIGCCSTRTRFFTPSPFMSMYVSATRKLRELWSSEQSPCILPSHSHLDARASVRRAASQRTPARAIGEGRGARPRATDEQLVGVGQGVCALPSRKESILCRARCEPGGGRRRATAAYAACRFFQTSDWE